MFFEWSPTYFVVQVAAGLIGAHLAARVAYEHRFGFIGHCVVGLVAGSVSGLCLQSLVMTTLTGTGDALPITAQALTYQAVCGFLAGGIAMLAMGVLCHVVTNATSSQNVPTNRRGRG